MKPPPILTFPWTDFQNFCGKTHVFKDAQSDSAIIEAKKQSAYPLEGVNEH